MAVDRSVVQAILAIIIVVGALGILVWDREARLPTELLWSLVSLVVGFYFGSATGTSGPPARGKS